MATVCNVSQNLSRGGTSGTGGFYIDYSVSDLEDRVVINSNAVIFARLDSASHSCTTKNYSSTSGWYVNGVQYLITNTSTEAVSTSKGTTVTKTLASGQTTIYKTHSAQSISVSVAVRL